MRFPPGTLFRVITYDGDDAFASKESVHRAAPWQSESNDIGWTPPSTGRFRARNWSSCMRAMGTENGGWLFIRYGGASVYPRGGWGEGGEEARWTRRWSMVSTMSALGRNETTLFRRTASTPPDSLTLASATFFPLVSTPSPYRHKGAFSWESENWKQFVFILAIKSLKIILTNTGAWCVERFAWIIQLILSSRCYIRLI